MQRLGWIGWLKQDHVQTYIELHANTWPSVRTRIESCHLRNYSIFYTPLPGGSHVLFSYAEYVGSDFEADMRRMAEDPEVQRWWDACKPCFERIEGLPPGEVWLPMKQIFYQS